MVHPLNRGRLLPLAVLAVAGFFVPTSNAWAQG